MVCLCVCVCIYSAHKCVCVYTVHTHTHTHARSLSHSRTQPAAAQQMHGGRALAMRGPSVGRGQLGGAGGASGPGTAYLLPVLLPQRLRGGEVRDGGWVGAGKGGLRGGGGVGEGGRYLSKGGTESYQRGGQRSAPRAHPQVISCARVYECGGTYLGYIHSYINTYIHTYIRPA